MKNFSFVFGLLTFAYLAQAADVPLHWQVLNDKSSIEWTANYGGKPVTGSFPEFAAQIAFDPAHPETGSAAVKIGTTTVKSADKDATESLPTDEWFASKAFPFANFTSKKFDACTGGSGSWTCTVEGTLAVRDKTVNVTLPFSIKYDDDKAATPPAHIAHIEGTTSVKRTVLGVGQGDWTSTDTIADDVKITIHLEAKQVP